MLRLITIPISLFFSGYRASESEPGRLERPSKETLTGPNEWKRFLGF